MQTISHSVLTVSAYATVPAPSFNGCRGFVLLAELGFTRSGGPFSAAAKSSGVATIQLPAVTRWQTSDRMRIDFDQAIAGHTVLLSAVFGDAF